MSCLQPELWGVLNKVAAAIGPLEIASGCDGRHAKNSYHYSGRAVDFRPMQGSVRGALAVLHALPEVGGVGSYSNGLVHADVGVRKFAWHGSRKTRFASARAGRARFASMATR